MEVSDQATGGGEPGGEQLIEALVTLSGLPGSLVNEDLGEAMEKAGHSPGSLTLTQLREVMLTYLEIVQASLSDSEEGEEGSEVWVESGGVSSLFDEGKPS